MTVQITAWELATGWLIRVKGIVLDNAAQYTYHATAAIDSEDELFGDESQT